MHERPILFSAPMVRALLAGTKTQTRRIIKPQPGPEFWDHRGYELVICDDGLMRFAWKEDGKISPHSPEVRCPYGHRGDRLWVRERMRRIGAVLDCFDRPTALDIKYEADGQIAIAVPFPKRLKGVPKHGQCLAYGGYREASRITLEITGVRVERLQGISEADAAAEGMERTGGGRYWLSELRKTDGTGCRMVRGSAVECYRDLWLLLNGEDSWPSNPWVWVVEFKRVDP